MCEPRYLARNPYFPAPPEMADVASPATAIFRLVPGNPPPPANRRPATTNELPRAVAPVANEIGRAHVELQSPMDLVCRLLLENDLRLAVCALLDPPGPQPLAAGACLWRRA